MIIISDFARELHEWNLAEKQKKYDRRKGEYLKYMEAVNPELPETHD